MSINLHQSSGQLFEIARECFNEHMKTANMNDDHASFNLSRGLLAMMEAIEKELSHLHSAIGRIER